MMNDESNVASLDQVIETKPSKFFPRRLYGLKPKDGLKFISSLILPLILGVFTSVIAIQQQSLARQQRDEDRNASKLHREQDKTLNVERYSNEILDTYIREMAILLKESSGSLTHDEVTAIVARAKTLNIFRKLDSQRNARIIRFLHEAKQLYDSDKRRSLDLSTAKLNAIDFRELSVNEKYLHNLSLTSIFLSNAIFINIQAEYINFDNTQFDNVTFSQSHLINVSFSNSRFRDIDFSSVHLHGVNFSYAELYNINFSFAHLKNIDFTFAKLNNISFLSAEFDNVDLSGAELNNVNFFNFRPRNANFTFTRFNNTDFTDAYLTTVYFTSTLIFNCRFPEATLTNIVVDSARFDNVDFDTATFHRVIFANSSFFNTNLSSPMVIKSEFPSTEFINTIISSFEFDQTNFTSSKFHQVSFVLGEFKETNFSKTILDSVKFINANMSGTDFQRAIFIKGVFASANLSNSIFISADIQGASFKGSDLNNVDFSEANMRKVDLTNTKITEKQLQSAISIQDALLPNGAFAQSKNLLDNDQTDCSVSFNDNWIIHKGNITAKISDTNPNNCYYFLRSYNIGATMSRRVDLSEKWNSNSWPHSQIVLTANMSIGVSIQLKVINSTKDTNIHARLNSTGRNITLALNDDIRQLDVFIEFSALSGWNSTTNYWCSDIKLFIIYSTYLESVRVIPQIPPSARWNQVGIKVAGGDEKGSSTDRLHEPYNFFFFQDKTMIIVERGNDRVIQWKIGDENGQLLAGGHGAGNGLNQLNRPSDVVFDKWTNSLIICSRDSKQVVRWTRHNGITQGESLIRNISCYGLAMDDQEFLYISDIREHSVKRYRMPNMNGIVVAGGNGKGSNKNQLNIPTCIFVDQQQSVYVSDSQNDRVMKWNKDALEGIIVAGGNGDGNSLAQLSFPNAVIVDTFDTVYVADMGNNRIMRWPKGAEQGVVIAGGRGQGSGSTQLHSPVGLSFDRRGNLYVADTGNHRIQLFLIE